MGMTKSVFGKTSNGEVVHLVTVSNEKGMSMEVLDYGATLVSVNVPDKDGHTEDVALGYDDVLDYEKGDRISRSQYRKMRKPRGSCRIFHQWKRVLHGEK